MAHAIQSIFPEAKFGVGPAIEGGFYYDFDIETKLTDEDLIKIENTEKMNPHLLMEKILGAFTITTLLLRLEL